MSESQPSTFRSRLVEEAQQLLQRHNKLIAFLQSAQFQSLDSEQQTLLQQQSYHMSCYLQLLHRRLELVNHPVSETESPDEN